MKHSFDYNLEQMSLFGFHRKSKRLYSRRKLLEVGLGALVLLYLYIFYQAIFNHKIQRLLSNTDDQPLYTRRENVFDQDVFLSLRQRLISGPLAEGQYLYKKNFGTTHGIVIQMNLEGLTKFYTHPLLKDMVGHFEVKICTSGVLHAKETRPCSALCHRTHDHVFSCI